MLWILWAELGRSLQTVCKQSTGQTPLLNRYVCQTVPQSPHPYISISVYNGRPPPPSPPLPLTRSVRLQRICLWKTLGIRLGPLSGTDRVKRRAAVVLDSTQQWTQAKEHRNRIFNTMESFVRIQRMHRMDRLEPNARLLENTVLHTGTHCATL